MAPHIGDEMNSLEAVEPDASRLGRLNPYR